MFFPLNIFVFILNFAQYLPYLCLYVRKFCTSDMIHLHFAQLTSLPGYIRRPIEEILKLLPGPHSETKRVSKFVFMIYCDVCNFLSFFCWPILHNYFGFEIQGRFLSSSSYDSLQGASASNDK